MDIKTEKITSLLKEQIEKFDSSVDVSEVGEVIELRDAYENAEEKSTVHAR